MDPERALILAGPLATFKSFKAENEETGPRLVHAQAHACIVSIFKELLVRLNPGEVAITLLKECLLDGITELVERVLTLET